MFWWSNDIIRKKRIAVDRSRYIFLFIEKLGAAIWAYTVVLSWSKPKEEERQKERKLWTIDKWAEIRYFCCSPTRLHNEGFSALWGVPKTALKWCLGTSYFFTFPSILAPASRLVYYVVVLAGRPGPPLHLIKSRNSSVQRGKRSSSTEKTLLIKLSDTILHYLHTDTHIKCAKKWLRQRRYFLGWKGIGIFLLMLGPSIY